MRAARQKPLCAACLPWRQLFWGSGWGFGLVFGYGLTRVANVVLNGQLKHNGLSVSNIITLPAWLIVSVLEPQRPSDGSPASIRLPAPHVSTR